MAYHSYHYSKGQRLCNCSICMFTDPATDDTRFGYIQLFCIVKNTHVAIVKGFGLTHVSPLEGLKSPQLSELSTDYEAFNTIVYKVKKLSVSNRTVAVPTSSIVHVPVKYCPVS